MTTLSLKTINFAGMGALCQREIELARVSARSGARAKHFHTTPRPSARPLLTERRSLIGGDGGVGGWGGGEGERRMAVDWFN